MHVAWPHPDVGGTIHCMCSVAARIIHTLAAAPCMMLVVPAHPLCSVAARIIYTLAKPTHSCSIVAGPTSQITHVGPLMLLVPAHPLCSVAAQITHVGRRTLHDVVGGASTIHCAWLLLESYTHWPNQPIGRSHTSTMITLFTATHWPHQHVGHRHLLVAGHSKDQSLLD